MISLYPHFTKLTIDHAKEIESITKKFKPYSDFNFTSLLCWDTDKTTMFSVLDGNLVIKLPDYITGETVISMLGVNNVDESLFRLLADSKELKLVPEVVIEKVKNKSIVAKEDSDNFDYIYSTRALSKFEGKIYKKKRNKFNSVSKEFGDRLTHKVYKSFDTKLSKEFIDLFVLWASKSTQTKEDAALEKRAIENLLLYQSRLNLMVVAIYLDGKVIAFSIMEGLSDGYAIVHFEKAIKIHDQIYVYVANISSNYLLKAGFEYVNWEQDLGITGLRKSKSSYAPHEFLKKYIVTK